MNPQELNEIHPGAAASVTLQVGSQSGQSKGGTEVVIPHQKSFSVTSCYCMLTEIFSSLKPHLTQKLLPVDGTLHLL